MASRGYPPRICTVRYMADLLLEARKPGGAQATVGQNWARNFINRHPDIKAKYTRKYDYKRALCEDPEVINPWFKLVENTIQKYGIAVEDIYNFDETGFAMGVAATSRVVTGSEWRGKAIQKQPGNREW